MQVDEGQTVLGVQMETAALLHSLELLVESVLQLSSHIAR